jgi:hypothetical protein
MSFQRTPLAGFDLPVVAGGEALRRRGALAVALARRPAARDVSGRMLGSGPARDSQQLVFAHRVGMDSVFERFESRCDRSLGAPVAAQLEAIRPHRRLDAGKIQFGYQSTDRDRRDLMIAMGRGYRRLACGRSRLAAGGSRFARDRSRFAWAGSRFACGGSPFAPDGSRLARGGSQRACGGSRRARSRTSPDRREYVLGTIHLDSGRPAEQAVHEMLAQLVPLARVELAVGTGGESHWGGRALSVALRRPLAARGAPVDSAGHIFGGGRAGDPGQLDFGQRRGSIF